MIEKLLRQVLTRQQEKCVVVMQLHLGDGDLPEAFLCDFRNEIMRCDSDSSTEEEELGPDDCFSVWVFF